MNPPPLDMTQAQEYLRGAQQQLQACIELRRAASMRITDLEAENAALKDRIKWWYEPCPNCGAPEGMALTSNGFNDTRVWCCLCRHDGKGVQGPIGKETDHEAIRLWNEESRLRWIERRERIALMEDEVAALRRDLATRESEYRILSDHAEKIEAEVAALREDKARLDRLERELLYNPAWPLIGCLLDGSLGILDMDAGSEFGDETVSDPTLRGAIDKAFARLDAARKGGKR